MKGCVFLHVTGFVLRSLLRSRSALLLTCAIVGLMLLSVGTRLPITGQGAGAFDLIDAYLERAAAGAAIEAHPMDGRYWADMGTPERFARAEADLAEGRITLEGLMG